jgi:acetyl-CoA carboxylase biotin carboxyl carrier protein
MSENTASAKAEEKAETRSGRKHRRGGSGKQYQAAKASLNMTELRELAELINEHGFTDFEFENENIRIRLSKMTAPPVFQAVQPFAAAQAGSSVSPQKTAPVGATQTEDISAETPTETDEDLYKITSPIVGTFYRSPAPDKEPYVKEGDRVSESTIVCIVEAMKLMNEIQAEVSGEIVKIYAESGQPVEYGQPLFGIKK